MAARDSQVAGKIVIEPDLQLRFLLLYPNKRTPLHPLPEHCLLLGDRGRLHIKVREQL